MEKIKLILKFLKRNWIIILILLLAAFLRLYKIGEYMTFLGDEGRDAIIVRRLLVNFDPILIGPGTSVGSMYLGPLYYYLIAPGLLLAKFSPIGPSIEVALIGVATVFLVYFVGKEWFSKRAGLIASGLYSISPTAIIFSKSSWNPNVMPFFSLLAVYAIWRASKKDQYEWIVVSAISFAFVLQSHYLGLLLLPVLLITWIMEYLKVSAVEDKIDETSKVTRFMKMSIISVMAFLFLMSPLFIFDLRHNWLNFTAMKKFVLEGNGSVSFDPWVSVAKLPEILDLISTRLLAGRMETLGKILVAVISIPSILLLLMRKKIHKNEAAGFSILTLWILTGLFGLGLYGYQIYDHYFGFLFTTPFLFVGGFLDGISENLSKVGKVIISLAFVYLVYINIINSPLKDNPNRQMQRARDVAEKIGEESKGEPFNLAVLAETNYEDGYQYFLEKENFPVVDIDAQVESSIQDQLFVVCEMIPEKCDPTHSPKTEVANFGWSKIEDSWEVDGVTIYKLVHSKK